MRFCFSLAAVAAVLTLSAAPSLASDLAGTVWNTDGGRAKIEFGPCKSSICGRIVALAKPTDDAGKPLTDKNNPDESLHKRPIMGLTTLYNIAPAGAGVWDATSYDPRNGQVNDVTLTLQGDDQLILKGCGLGGLICKTFTWTLAGMAQ